MAGQEDEWGLSAPHLEAEGQWFYWNDRTPREHRELVKAVQRFEAHDKNPEAARAATEWFIEDSRSEQACVTRILVADGHVAAYYALSSGEIRLTSSTALEAMGLHGSARVGSSHVEWIARDRRAPGAGKLAVRHAISTAAAVAELQGNRALTMDPYDEDTHRMWREMGFRNSQLEVRDGLFRLYIPLFGLVPEPRIKRLLRR